MAQNLYSREPQTGLWRGGLGCFLSPRADGKLEFAALELSLTGFHIAGDGKGLAVADLNADGRPDLLATQNDGALLAFQQRTRADDGGILAIRLDGPAGNPSGLGAVVRLVVGEETRETAEVYGGSGYLSQSCSTVFYPRPADGAARVDVKWPGGEQSSVSLSPGQARVVLTAAGD